MMMNLVTSLWTRVKYHRITGMERFYRRKSFAVVWTHVGFRHWQSCFTADGEVQQTSGGHSGREDTGPSSGEAEDGSAVIQWVRITVSCDVQEAQWFTPSRITLFRFDESVSLISYRIIYISRYTGWLKTKEWIRWISCFCCHLVVQRLHLLSHPLLLRQNTFIGMFFAHTQTQLYFNKLYLCAGMLPKPVADDLRQGRTAEAQTFSNATVYFRFVKGRLCS